MKDTQIVHILNISLLESKRGTVLLSQEMQCIERLCLRFTDGRNISRARLRHEACEVAAGVLDQHSLRGVRCGRLMVKKGTGAVWLCGIGESALLY